MRGLEKLPAGDRRQVMSRPNKDSQGRTFTWLRTKAHYSDTLECILSDYPRPDLSRNACALSVRGTVDRLSWMHTHYYRKRTTPKDRCKCCGQTMPRLQSLNTAGKRRLATLKRRIFKRKNKLLSPPNRPLSWIVWIEDITVANRLSKLL